MRRDEEKSIVCPVVLAVFTALGCAQAAATDQSPKPNMILCMTDDQGWGDVSYNGLKHIQTPNLDAMAAAGLRFNRFYAQQSCSPTRASVMTGRHPNRMGVFWPGMPLRKQEITVAQAAKHAGYVTGHFGKWHLNGVAGPGKVMPDSDPLSPRNCGFDESFSVSNYFETNSIFGRNGIPMQTSGDGSDVIVAEALTFIGKTSAQTQPFLAVIWFGSPHAPHRPLPVDLQAAGGSAYFGELIAVDRSMGTLRSGLRQLGIADNTLVWFCSDNGGWQDPKKPDANGVTGGLRGRKGDMHEGGIRVPCVIEWPVRIKQPVVTEIPAGVVDIYPTLVEIMRAKVPSQVEPLDGISLLPLMDGQMKERSKPMGFWQGYGGTATGPAAWSDNRYKLVKLGDNTYELYDLPGDLSEQTNLAAQHPEIVSRMKAELETWQQSVLRSFRGADYPTHQPASDAQATPPPVHQMYNAGHFFELAVAHAQLTGDPKTIVLPVRPEGQLATGLGELGMAGIFQRFLTGWLSPSPFGLGAFPACRRHPLLPLGGAELVLGTVGAMHRQHVQLYTKRHFLFTNGADHRHSFLPDSEFTSEP